MKTYGGEVSQIHVFLLPALAGGKWLLLDMGAKHSRGEEPSGAHWKGSCAGPKGGLDDEERRKMLLVPGFEL
jgi:hypothetical protein